MFRRAYIAETAALTRVLVVASDATTLAPVCLELMQRGASVSGLQDIAKAAAAARAEAFDIIMVAGREDANATALFLQLLKAEALGSPRIMLLVDPARASEFGQSLFAADEMLATTLAPDRIADATGIGVDTEAPATYALPAVVRQPDVKVLALPTPFPRDLLPGGMANAERGEVPDAVILTEPGADAAISAWMSAATAAVIPIIDATGTYGERADAAMETISGLGIQDAVQRVKPLTARMKQLPDAFFRTRDTKAMVLARLAVRDRGLTAVHDAGLKQIVRYRDETAIAGIQTEAEALARAGLLRKSFFEKVQCCPSCTSARLIVREECAHCRSADVTEEPIIHHLRCGYQGPERDFRQGRDLVCPKCRHHCEHFSVDYDKPGTLVLCNACGHTTGEAEVGFKCLDCDSGFASDKATARTFHEFALTDAGLKAAFQPPLGGYGGDGPEQSGSVRDRMRRFVAANRAAGTDCAALMIKTDPDGTVAQKIGERRFQQVLALYISILRELFESDVEIVESATAFLVLISTESRAAVETSLPEIRRELEQHLAVDLQARYHVFGPDEMMTLL
jgi:hypothetical protein